MWEEMLSKKRTAAIESSIDLTQEEEGSPARQKRKCEESDEVTPEKRIKAPEPAESTLKGVESQWNDDMYDDNDVIDGVPETQEMLLDDDTEPGGTYFAHKAYGQPRESLGNIYPTDSHGRDPAAREHLGSNPGLSRRKFGV